MKILAIDTSCDETSVAITNGRRILSNELYSQILVHKKWGGVVPNLAKRAHEERIDGVIESALKKAKVTMTYIDYIAVTYGPGLAIALGVGINKAKELAKKYNKKLIAVNHMEGHIYSCFAQNSKGNPDIEFSFPYIALLVSGSHTELVILNEHVTYNVIGETLDDAAGEAIDKALRMLMNDMVYPGGPIVERLAQAGNPDYIRFPRPMERSQNLDFSFSGLKTALLYELRRQKILLHQGFEGRVEDGVSKKRIEDLAASFQEAVFHSLTIKLGRAMKKHSIKNVVVGGGVVANMMLRKKIRNLVKKYDGTVLFPPFKNLNGDNAAMIGIAAHYKAKKEMFIDDIDSLERQARARL